MAVKIRQCLHVRALRGGLSLAAICLALWAGFAPLALRAQTSAINAPLSGPQLSPAIQELVKRATGGEAGAQCDLGALYANGDGVPQDFATSVTWFRKAAEQDDARAQLRLGTSYLEGKGIGKDIDEAIKWLYKAAGHGSGTPNIPAQTVSKGMFFKKLVTVDGEVFDRATVERAEPDGILITYKAEKGGFGMAKVQFKNLPGDIQKACGYDPQAEAALMIQQQAMEEVSYAELSRKIAERKIQKSEVVMTLANIVSSYHKTHTYLTNETGNNIYVCGDMACDVWDMVIAKGINAKILVGNVDQDITSVALANHAWVLAEISDGEWLALEATGGFAVRSNENKRYFVGCKFPTAKDYRDFDHLRRQYNEAVLKGRAAEDAYNKLVSAYNGADINGRVPLKGRLERQSGVLNDRWSEAKQLKAEMDTFRLTGD